jgi:hypothetical protein
MRIERAGKSKTKDRSHVTEHFTTPGRPMFRGTGRQVPYLIHNSGMSLVTIPTRRRLEEVAGPPAVRATMLVGAQVLQQVPSQARDGRGASCWMERPWAGCHPTAGQTETGHVVAANQHAAPAVGGSNDYVAPRMKSLCIACYVCPDDLVLGVLRDRLGHPKHSGIGRQPHRFHVRPPPRPARTRTRW